MSWREAERVEEVAAENWHVLDSLRGDDAEEADGSRGGTAAMLPVVCGTQLQVNEMITSAMALYTLNF